MKRNYYAVWNRYGNRANGARQLHVFPDREARDEWVGDGQWSDDMADYRREAVTVAEAVAGREYVTAVRSHGDVGVPDWLRRLCLGVWPYYPFPDRWPVY